MLNHQRCRHLLLLFALTFAACLWSNCFDAWSAESASAPHDFAKWNQLIHRELDGNLAGGYAYEILQHGRPVAIGEYGYARAPWEKIDPSVRFTTHKIGPIASVSKTITAVAMLKLWEEKKGSFSLDAPFWPIIRHIVPDPSPSVKRITIRQVLMHRTGFPGFGDISTHRELAKLLHLPLIRRPGEKFDYHNNNYYLARVLIEQLAHDSYPHYVQKHVLTPMGIFDMRTRSERYAPMCGYGDADERKPGYSFAWDCTKWAGGAGWYGSVNDLARFMRGLREHKVLSEKTTEMLFHDDFGLDWEEPGFGKSGDWVCPEEEINGEVHTAVCYFPDDIEAAIMINGVYEQGPLELLEDTWSASRKKAKRL